MKNKALKSILFIISLAISMSVVCEAMAVKTEAYISITESEVHRKIAELNALFPNGSYFTTDGKRSCTAIEKNTTASGYVYYICQACEKCKLENILKQNDKAKNTIVPSVCLGGNKWSCCAFANFAYCYIFEHDVSVNRERIYSSNYGGVNYDFFSQLKPGDQINFGNGQHFAIFLSCDSTNVYLYESNYGAPNKVYYNHKREISKISWGTAVAYRSNSYTNSDDKPVNDYYELTSPDGVQTVRSSASTSSDSLGTIPAGKIVCVTKYNADKSWGYLTYGNISGWIRLYYVKSYSPPEISSCSVSAISDQTYTGAALTPSFTVKYNNTELTKDKHYNVEYSNNINAGTATVKIKGKDNFYLGTKTVTFTIKGKPVSALTISSIPTQTYSAKAITPEYTVKDVTRTLTNNVDYTGIFSNNTNIGTATLTITGKGNYTGTKSIFFDIVNILPAKPVVTAPSIGRVSIKLAWNAVSEAESYSIWRYSDGVYVPVEKNITATSYIVTGLTPSTDYKFLVKAYNSAGYSSSSTTDLFSVRTIAI